MGIVNKQNFEQYSDDAVQKEKLAKNPSEKMVKFVFEVSEGYINERSDANLLTNSNENAAKLMMDFVGFLNLKNKVKEGETEFYISSKNIKNGNSDLLKLFNMTMSEIAACVAVFDKKEEK